MRGDIAVVDLSELDPKICVWEQIINRGESESARHMRNRQDLSCGRGCNGTKKQAEEVDYTQRFKENRGEGCPFYWVLNGTGNEL